MIIRSDVPIGVALSGGLDSSLVAALATKYYPGIMHAFSVGYPGRPEFDEREEARTFADYLGMPFHEIELDANTIVRNFTEIVFKSDDPIADISAVSYYTISKVAREQGVAVMLQGQAGDELFWGYPWVTQALNTTIAKRDAKNSMEMFFKYMKPSLLSFSTFKGLKQWIKSIAGLRDGWEQYSLTTSGPADQMVFYNTRAPFKYTSSHYDTLYTREFTDQLDSGIPTNIFTTPRPWKHIDIHLTRLICQTYLLENGIQLGDRLSMASSVELRLPLADYRLVETVIGLRKNYADHNKESKSWLRAAVKDIVPEWVMNRRKRGFQPPTRDWYYALSKEYGSMLADGYLVHTGILHPESAHLLAKPESAHFLARRVYGRSKPISFAALVLEVWCQRQLSAIGEEINNTPDVPVSVSSEEECHA